MKKGKMIRLNKITTMKNRNVEGKCMFLLGPQLLAAVQHMQALKREDLGLRFPLVLIEVNASSSDDGDSNALSSAIWLSFFSGASSTVGFSSFLNKLVNKSLEMSESLLSILMVFSSTATGS